MFADALPSAYVVYRIADHKDYDTKVIDANANPEFRDSKTWQMGGVSGELHQYLQNEVRER
jgi:hypothetical protein